MADKFSKEQRSEIMRLIKSNRNKSTELKLIKFFKENRITGWRRNYRLFGKPDFTFPKVKTAIFIDGCFWHGHICKKLPQNNADYWQRKIDKNKSRDVLVTNTLDSKGWNVIRLWECELYQENLLTIFQSYIPISQ